MQEVKLLIVEDDPLIAEDIASTCKDQGYVIQAVVHTAGDALVALQENKIDLVLLDINLEDEIDGTDIAKYINVNMNVPFIYITSYSDMQTLAKVKNTKPIGYIVKPFVKAQLISNIEIALHNLSQQPSVTGLNIQLINDKLIQPLSDREVSILHHIYKGKSNKQMADLEFVSTNTIKYHVKQLYQKLGAHSRSSLLAKLREF